MSTPGFSVRIVFTAILPGQQNPKLEEQTEARVTADCREV
jgi:hypothetical protein